MAKYEYLGAIASSLGLFAFVSIVIRVFYTKSTVSITNISLFSNLLGQSLLLFYSYSNNLKGLMYPIFIYCVGLFYIIYIKNVVNKELF